MSKVKIKPIGARILLQRLEDKEQVGGAASSAASGLLARAVKVTLGPKGRNVVIDKTFTIECMITEIPDASRSMAS